MAAGRTSKVFLALSASVAVITVGGCGGDEAGGGSTLTWFIFNEPSGALTTVAERCSEESGGRYSIEFEFLPNDADSQREQLVRRLGAEDSSIDIVGMDVIWTGEFANAGWLEEFTGETKQAVSRNVFPSVLETAMYEDALYGAPIWTNTELLWYRDDLVKKPPKTWDEMIAAAEQIGPEEGLIQVQGNRYEGLTVWVNQMIASAGTSNTLSAERPPMSRMYIFGWSPSASIRNVTSAPNTSP